MDSHPALGGSTVSGKAPCCEPGESPKAAVPGVGYSELDLEETPARSALPLRLCSARSLSMSTTPATTSATAAKATTMPSFEALA